MLSDQIKNEFLQQFGKKLSEVRKAKGLSYRKLDENCGLDYSYISKIEKGEANVTLETIIELCIGLNKQPKELFDFDFNLEKE